MHLKFISILISLFAFTLFASEPLSLWEVKGRQNRLYLMGSLHLLKESDYPLDSAYYHAFNKSKHIAFEVDLDKANSLAFQLYMLKQSQLPVGTTLRDVVAPETYKKCALAFQEMGGSIERVKQFKPFFVGMTLTLLKMQQLGFNPLIGIDRHFHKLAKGCNKTIYGLETAESQIELLVSLDTQEGDLLASTVDEVENIEKEITHMALYWKTGNAQGLDSLINMSISEYPTLKERLLLQRNRNWMIQLESFLTLKEDVFVVVGAGHIGGEGGLLSLLTEKGYKVLQQSRLQ